MSEREFERKVKEWLDRGYSNSEVIHTIECNYLGTCIAVIKFFFTEKYNRNDYYTVSLHCIYNPDKKEVAEAFMTASQVLRILWRLT